MGTKKPHLFQSFNFRERKKLKPYYDLVSSITAEELGHVELVSHTMNLLFKDTTTVPFDVNDTAKSLKTKDLVTCFTIGMR
jgi:Mn-containing catalase